MRILHCIPNMLNGGAQRQLTYLAAEQVRRGWPVHVALLYEGPNFERLQASSAAIHRLSGWGNHDPRLLGQLIWLMRRVKPDLVQTWLNQMDVLGGLAAHLVGLPWVLSERSSAQAYPPTLKNRLRATVGRWAQAVVANSAGGDAYWSTRLGPSVRRYVIPNIVPLAEIAQTRPLALEAISLEAGRKMVLYVGRLSPEKNLENLAQALRLAAAQIPLTAYLCGDGTHQDWMEGLLQAQGLSGLVRSMGYQANIWPWLKRADVFISVSTFEGQPNAVLEAMACGCPLVLSDIPAHREIAGEQSAWLVNPASPAEIARGLVCCLSEPAEAQGRAKIAQAGILPLSAAAIAEQYEQVYQDVVSGKKIPSVREII